jgi:hypothetical protein
MQRVFLPLTMVACVLTTVVPVGAADTVTGEVIEVECHIKLGANGTGEGHAECALKCARGGGELGILTAFGVYTITGEMTENNNAKLLDFVAKNVEVTGEVTEGHGDYWIEVASIAVK